MAEKCEKSRIEAHNNFADLENSLKMYPAIATKLDPVRISLDLCEKELLGIKQMDADGGEYTHLDFKKRLLPHLKKAMVGLRQLVDEDGGKMKARIKEAEAQQ